MAQPTLGSATALFILTRDTTPGGDDGLTLDEINERAQKLTDDERKQIDKIWLDMLERGSV